jgi:hypothetical protein
VRTQLGGLTFLLTIAFVGGLVVALIGATWFGLPRDNGLIGFFGFGIPMVVAGLGTAALWSGHKPLEKTLGWASALVGLVCGVALFILVAGWILTKESDTGFLHFFAFAIPMLVCGSFGIAMLLKSEP